MMHTVSTDKSCVGDIVASLAANDGIRSTERKHRVTNALQVPLPLLFIPYVIFLNKAQVSSSYAQSTGYVK